MAGWVLVPCLEQFRSELNVLCPNRDRVSDGTIGDQAHADRSSDHNPDETGAVPIRDVDKTNEVHALDVDVDLRRPGLTMEMLVQHVLERCRSGAETRLRYVIYNGRIWSASDGWRKQKYNGANPHDKHAHFSASYVTACEASTAPWHLEEAVPVTAPTAAQNAAAVAAQDVDPTAGTYSLGGALWTTLARTASIGPTKTLVEALSARVEDVDDELDGLGASMVLVVSLLTQVTNEPGLDPNVWYDVAKAGAAAALAEARDQ